MGRKQKLKAERRAAKQVEKEADQTIELTVEQIEALLDRLESRALLEPDYSLLIWIVQNYTAVQQKLASRESSMNRLQNLLFGPKSEGAKCQGIQPNESTPQEGALKPKRPGHGRKSKDEWAEKPLLCPHAHDSLQASALCPKCKHGKLYEYKPSVHVRIKANPLFEVEHHELQRLRCSSCGWLFTAKMPVDLQKSPSATPEAIALTAMLRYQGGFPKYRLLVFLKIQGIFLTWSKLWDWMVNLFEILLPVFEFLKRLAREGKLVQNDDTRMKVLELVKENKKNPELDRTEIQTSAIISHLPSGQQIRLFFTGRAHAGENLSALLEGRQTPGKPLQMCDAHPKNLPKEDPAPRSRRSKKSEPVYKTEPGFCLDHLRRPFAELGLGPDDPGWFLIDRLKQVYEAEAQSKELGLHAEARLKLHQEQSTKPMEEIFQWLKAESEAVEPNSELGKALAYGIRHWQRLTAFLRIAGMPISNIDTERLIKTAVLHRKGSYFYKTCFGAQVGDALMSIIQTAAHASVNVLHYLVSLQKHDTDVKERPELWLPWNYAQRLVQLNPA